MPRPPPPELLFGPYRPPALRKGARAFCFYRDCDVVITGMSAGPIAWPRCRALGVRGGSGLLIDAELKRAICSESAMAVEYWWRVNETTVTHWRRTFGIKCDGTEVSRRLIRAAA